MSCGGVEPRASGTSFERLAARVADVSQARLCLVDTQDRGRCLEAAVDLPAGLRILDAPVVPHGSDRGVHFADAAMPGVSAARQCSSSDLLAALDFLASLAKALASVAITNMSQKPGGSGCNAERTLVCAMPKNDIESLWSLYRFPEDRKRVPMIRHWHQRWRPELSSIVAVETLEAAWRRVVPNWRRLTVSVPRGAQVMDKNNMLQPALAHEVICGLWLLMALCEHSCNPNCALVHDGRDLWFLTLRAVRAGEALTTSYLNLQALSLSVELRRAELLEAWSFECVCTRCSQSRSPTAEVEDGDIDICEKERLERFFRSCISPPGDDLQDRIAYCNGLDELRRIAHRLHGSFEPTTATLLLLEAIFAPERERQAEACRNYSEVCAWLYGENASATQRGRALVDDPAQFLHEVLLEAGTRSAARSLCDDTLGDDLAAADDTEGSPRAALRALYRRHFLSRGWPRRLLRCRVADAGPPEGEGERPFFVAAAAASPPTAVGPRR